MAEVRSPRTAPRSRDGAVPSRSRFDRRLAEILEHATNVFYEHGYEGASMRDLSRATGMSLAGLYHYCESKERLLYLIQKHTFDTILERLEARLGNTSDPEQRVKILIANHLEYFIANQKGMTVLSHEDEVLKGEYGDGVREIKRRYYQICRAMLDALKAERGLEINTRVAVLALFGMMNWIYTWYRPQVDAGAGELAAQISDIFLSGVLAGRSSSGKRGLNGAVSVKTAARSRKSASSNI